METVAGKGNQPAVLNDGKRQAGVLTALQQKLRFN